MHPYRFSFRFKFSPCFNSIYHVLLLGAFGNSSQLSGYQYLVKIIHIALWSYSLYQGKTSNSLWYPVMTDNLPTVKWLGGDYVIWSYTIGIMFSSGNGMSVGQISFHKALGFRLGNFRMHYLDFTNDLLATSLL